MSNKLLTESELRNFVFDVFQDLDIRIDEGQPYIHNQEESFESLLKMFKSYADSIIGEDDILSYPTYPVKLKDRNDLRAEQRQRNHSTTPEPDYDNIVIPQSTGGD